MISNREIQIKADHFRQNCKVIDYRIADFFGECERAGYRVVRYPIGENAILGFAQFRDGDKIIFTNSSARLSREIFSAAHELGHLLLHIAEDEERFIDDLTTINDHDEIMEKEANYFAACLVMPETEVMRYIHLVMADKAPEKWTALDIAKMMTAFQASFDTVLFRLQNLKIINLKTKHVLESEKNEKTVTRLLKMVGGDYQLNRPTNERKIPDQYMTWVLENYKHGAIPKETLEKVLGYFDLSLDDIREEICADIEEEKSLDELIGGIDI